MIFQPGLISHPTHQMAPEEHALSRSVLEFLIEHQDSFMLGMQLVSLDSYQPDHRHGCLVSQTAHFTKADHTISCLTVGTRQVEVNHSEYRFLSGHFSHFERSF